MALLQVALKLLPYIPAAVDFIQGDEKEEAAQVLMTAAAKEVVNARNAGGKPYQSMTDQQVVDYVRKSKMVQGRLNKQLDDPESDLRQDLLMWMPQAVATTTEAVAEYKQTGNKGKLAAVISATAVAGLFAAELFVQEVAVIKTFCSAFVGS